MLQQDAQRENSEAQNRKIQSHFVSRKDALNINPKKEVCSQSLPREYESSIISSDKVNSGELLMDVSCHCATLIDFNVPNISVILQKKKEVKYRNTIYLNFIFLPSLQKQQGHKSRIYGRT